MINNCTFTKKSFGKICVFAFFLLITTVVNCLAGDTRPESEVIEGVGIIDEISGEYIVINDTAFHMGPETKYLREDGLNASINRFSKGTNVKFSYNADTNALLGLQQTSIEQEETEGIPRVEGNQQGGSSTIKEENGVWRN